MPAFYTTYDISTGNIVMTQLVGSLEEARLNEIAGQATIEGDYLHNLYKVVDGQAVLRAADDPEPPPFSPPPPPPPTP